MKCSPRIMMLPLVALCGLHNSEVRAQCVASWSTYNPALSTYAYSVWDEDGSGPGRPVLVAGQGVRPLLTGQPTYVIKYDGRAWRPVGEPFWGRNYATYVWATAPCSNTGVNSPAPGLYAAGTFETLTGGEPARSIAHFDGVKWNAFPGAIVGYGLCLAMFDEDGAGPDEPNLFLGGTMYDVNGIGIPGIVRWDGTEFSILGRGLSMSTYGTDPSVTTMMVWDDDGPGPNEPALYVGGGFEVAGGEQAWGIARWTGSAWETLGLGLHGGVMSLAAFDPDGDGPQPEQLYAGGGFNALNAQGQYVWCLGRFDGADWQQVEGYNGGGVYALETFDEDGQGPGDAELIVSGLFYEVAGVRANGIVKYDGKNWEAMGQGLTGMAWASARDMQVFDEDNDPTTPDGLYVGGNFDFVGGIWSPGHGRWGCPNPVCFADCDDSGGPLDIFDFLCFQNSFVNSETYACDCDTSTGNGVCDIFDFLCFQDAFVGGCP